MKKVFVVIGCIIAIILFALLYNYMQTEKVITRYKQGIVVEDGYPEIGGIISPYVYHYDKGNNYFALEDYDNAVMEYRKSLEHKMPEEKECQVRINLALAMTRPLTPESVTKENVDEYIKILEEARDMLCEKGCANMNDENGHSKDAQTLKDEIDLYIELLKNPPQGGGSGDDNNNQPQQQPQPSEGNNTKEEQAKQDKLMQDQMKGMEERNKEIANSQNLDNYDFDRIFDSNRKSW